jgi:uncharacterized protein
MSNNPDCDGAVDFLINRINIIALYLFGSAVNGRFTDDSDFDIAVLSQSDVDPVRLFELSLSLGVLMRRDVHLVDFKKADTVFQAEILRNKKVLYCRDENKRIVAEMITLTQYEKLNEEREVVIRAKYGDKMWMSL